MGPATSWLPMAAEADAAVRRRRPTTSVRARTTLAAAVVVGLAFTVGGIVLVTIMRRTLTSELRDAARREARDIAAVLASGGDPVLSRGGEDQVVQIIDRTGRVVDASSNARDLAPLDVAAGSSAEVDLVVDEDPFLVVAEAWATAEGPATVVVGRTIDDVNEAVRLVIQLLSVGLPVLLVIVGAVTWRLVGRALRPVDDIRTEVESIATAADLARRVPDPPGDDEIARLARTMNEMLGRLERSQIRQRRFVADASHELRSPVASIRQHVEVAAAHPGRTSVEELATIVNEENLRVERLVADLLVLARVDEGAANRPTTAVDLDDLAFDEARRLRESSGLRISTERVSAGRVAGDAEALRRVLRNLGDNASRHARSAVELTLRESADAVVLTVEDDGPGIAPEEREHVLERFVRLDDARSRHRGGAGLGLAIVRELMALHGGSVSIGASALGGTSVELRLPRLDDGSDARRPGG